MTIRTYRGWIRYYEKHSRDKWEPPLNSTILFDPRKGIVSFHIDRDLNVLYVDQMAGDGRHWFELGKAIVKKEGLSAMRMFTRRDPKVLARYHARRYGIKITGIEIEIGGEDHGREHKDSIT